MSAPSSDGPDGGAQRVRELEAELDRARHAVAGFKRRLPDSEEPWLIDWLQSESKRALEPMLRGGALHAPGDASGGGT